ncbi:hypothetical protein HK098_003701 [Nowakowskiella sp. JEL0407]|nr:hypothetical protein HK098_003701 [Nowakowskiella sp. JEL0407]
MDEQFSDVPWTNDTTKEQWQTLQQIQWINAARHNAQTPIAIPLDANETATASSFENSPLTSSSFAGTPFSAVSSSFSVSELTQLEEDWKLDLLADNIFDFSLGESETPIDVPVDTFMTEATASSLDIIPYNADAQLIAQLLNTDQNTAILLFENSYPPLNVVAAQLRENLLLSYSRGQAMMLDDQTSTSIISNTPVEEETVQNQMELSLYNPYVSSNQPLSIDFLNSALQSMILDMEMSESSPSPGTSEEILLAMISQNKQDLDSSSSQTASNTVRLNAPIFFNVSRGAIRVIRDYEPNVSVHTMEPSDGNRCAKCNVVFRRPSDLRRHEQIHTTVRYYCQFPGCMRKYNRYDNLGSHMKRCHGTRPSRRELEEMEEED